MVKILVLKNGVLVPVDYKSSKKIKKLEKKILSKTDVKLRNPKDKDIIRKVKNINLKTY